MMSSDQIKEFRCFYDAKQRMFHSVVQLGREVCGYPQIVHGGLTASIVDESFGGLYTCMLTSGALGVQLPAYTARLEVNYKSKIPAGSLLLVSTEVEAIEGRKIWMSANITDGGNLTYGTARALFVTPQPTKVVQNLKKSVFG